MVDPSRPQPRSVTQSSKDVATDRIMFEPDCVKPEDVLQMNNPANAAAGHNPVSGLAGRVCQSPRVKSGKRIGALPFAMDISDSGNGALQVAAS